MEAAQPERERCDSEQAPESEGEPDAEARVPSFTVTELTRWKHVRWARGVIVVMALASLVSLPREPWTLTLVGGLLALAYWVSRRAPLPGLLIGFASALPAFASAFVSAVLDWGPAYPAELAEDELPPARTWGSQWHTFSMLLFATLLWQGLAAAARLTGEVQRSWYLLRPALLLSVALASLSSFVLLSEAVSAVAALVLELILVGAAAPTLWRARGEWSTLGDPRRLAPRHALETAGSLLAVVAFMQGYFHLAGRFGLESLDSVEAYLFEGWPEYAILLLVVGWGPLVEEILFRGFVQSRFERVTTRGTALVAQAMLFSAAHAVSGSLVSHAVLGLVFGFLRNRTGTLYAPFVLHAAYNAWVVLSDLGHLPEILSFGSEFVDATDLE